MWFDMSQNWLKFFLLSKYGQNDVGPSNKAFTFHNHWCDLMVPWIFFMWNSDAALLCFLGEFLALFCFPRSIIIAGLESRPRTRPSSEEWCSNNASKNLVESTVLIAKVENSQKCLVWFRLLCNKIRVVDMGILSLSKWIHLNMKSETIFLCKFIVF